MDRLSISPSVLGRTFLTAPQGTPFPTGLPLPCTPLPASPSALRRSRPRPGVTRAALPPPHFTVGPRRLLGGKGSLRPLELSGVVGTCVSAPWTVVREPAPRGPQSGDLHPGPRDRGLGPADLWPFVQHIRDGRSSGGREANIDYFIINPLKGLDIMLPL